MENDRGRAIEEGCQGNQNIYVKCLGLSVGRSPPLASQETQPPCRAVLPMPCCAFVGREAAGPAWKGQKCLLCCLWLSPTGYKLHSALPRADSRWMVLPEGGFCVLPVGLCFLSPFHCCRPLPPCSLVCPLWKFSGEPTAPGWGSNQHLRSHRSLGSRILN